MSVEKLRMSIGELKHALSFEKEALQDRFYFSGLAKSFEVALEYSWKHLQSLVVVSGLEAPSPRDAIKQAGKIGEINNVELWLSFLRVRNIAVHDYLGISPSDYFKTIKEFAVEAEILLGKCCAGQNEK